VPELRTTVFSDFSCPYSYVTEETLRSLVEGELVVDHRAYELFPEPEPLGAAQEVDLSLADLATRAGIELRTPDFRPRTRKAHEAARFARGSGVEGEMRRAIFAAYLGEGRDIGRIDVLTELAAGIGLDPEELKIALDIDRYRPDVLHDLDVARRLRIPGTPAVFVGTGTAAKVLLGARTAGELADAIAEVRSRVPMADHDQPGEQGT
jgi:predicted DsbA family dithiol-disulfide isomerase